MNATLPSVRHQRAAIKIDTKAARFSGWTELKVAAPAAGGAPVDGSSGRLGLHCYGLNVQSVLVNGTPASFEVVPFVREDLPESVAAASYDSSQRQLAAVAESAFYMYERQLQRERQPELTILMPPLQQRTGSIESPYGASSSAGGSKNELCIRVEYSGGDSGAGVHFWQRYACTDNQVRRASAWLPCVDVPGAAASFQVDITCRADEMAVGPGQLLRQSWADEKKQWRTFHYTLLLSCAPCHLGFAVGTFRLATESVPVKNSAVAGDGEEPPTPPPPPRQLTHFAPLELSAELQVAAVLAAPPVVSADDSPKRAEAVAANDGLSRSAHFSTLVFKLFEELLGTQCPLPAMQQAFLPPEMLLSDSQVLAGLHLLSTARLIQPRAIEQSIAARCAIARCLARQWFGVLLRAATPLDEWLVEGLAGWLEQQCVQRYMGRNELAYRRWRERHAIFLADNGEAPPLAARGVSVPSPWGPLYGTERLDPAGLWSTKATAVVAMLEKRAGEELFRKHVATVVAAAVTAIEAEQAATTARAGGAADPAAVSPMLVAGAAATEAAGGAPASSPQQQQQQQATAGTGIEGVGNGRLLDTMTFLNELGRAGSFKKEMGPFAARWVYGRGVPHITAGYVYHGRTSALEMALKQTGSESSKRAADIAERAAVAEGSNAGIIKAVVREGEGYTDHPVHLGGEAFVLAELKVAPVVEKKQPGRRGRKRRDEGEGEEVQEDPLAAVATPEEPVLWVRLDPAGELLCDIKLFQPERMLALQLLHSRDVVAQAEAVQRLAELRVDSSRQQLGVDALRRTLHDRAVFYRVRCDAALALARLRDEQGQAAGLNLLVDFYKSHYFHPGTDAPRSVAISDPSEYFVAQAVATAVSLCREPDGTSPMDVLLLLPLCLQDYASVPGAPFSDYGLVAALCASLGNIQFEGFGTELLTLLEKFLERDCVLVSPGNSVGCACLAAMAALCANGTCSEEEQEQVATVVRRVRQSPGLSVSLRNAALAATLSLAASQHGPLAALQLAVAAAENRGRRAADAAPMLLLPSISTASLLLEEAAQLVAAAATEAAGAEGHWAVASSLTALQVPMQLLQRLAALLSFGQDCQLRHLAFVTVQLLAAQPPTLYRPPPGEAEEDAVAFFSAAGGQVAAGQAVSMGATLGQQHPSAGPGPAAVAPKIRLQLGGGGGAGGGGGTKSMAISGGADEPSLSGGGPAVSDARALSFGAVEQPQQQQQQQFVPVAAQGQEYSPVRLQGEAGSPPFFRPDTGEEASSRQQPAFPLGSEAAGSEQVPPSQPSLPPPPQQHMQAQPQHGEAYTALPEPAAASLAAPKLRFKMSLPQSQQLAGAGANQQQGVSPAGYRHQEQQQVVAPAHQATRSTRKRGAPQLESTHQQEQVDWTAQQQPWQLHAGALPQQGQYPSLGAVPITSATPTQHAPSGWDIAAAAWPQTGEQAWPAAAEAPPPVAPSVPAKPKIKLKLKLPQ